MLENTENITNTKLSHREFRTSTFVVLSEVPPDAIAIVKNGKSHVWCNVFSVKNLETNEVTLEAEPITEFISIFITNEKDSSVSNENANVRLTNFLRNSAN